MTDQQQWWAPVWRGLAVDAAGRHYRKMGNAVWLYIYLLLHADRSTGFLKRKSWTISRDMGIKERTIRKWRGILRRHGYIRTHQEGIYVDIEITKWKGTDGRHKCATQGDTDVPLRATRSCRPYEIYKGPNHFHLSQESDRAARPNDISIKRDILKDDIDKGSSHRAFKDFRPRDRIELLALDLADALDDRNNLPFYISYAKRYPEQLLRSVLGEVKEVPFKKIKKSRGALFNHLVQKYGQQADNDSGD